MFCDAITFNEINFDGIRDNLEDQRFNDLEKLLSSPQHLNGDFWWIDYRNEHRLLAIGDEELAELCFLAHLGRPLKSPFFRSLENRFVYIGHDNGYHTSIFVRDRLDGLQMLWKAIKDKAHACGFLVKSGGNVLDRLQEGLVFDFSAISEVGLPVWIHDEDSQKVTFIMTFCGGDNSLFLTPPHAVLQNNAATLKFELNTGKRGHAIFNLSLVDNGGTARNGSNTSAVVQFFIAVINFSLKSYN